MSSIDPTVAATEKLELAETAVFDAIRLLNYYQTESLMQVAGYLQNVVKELKAGEKKNALALPVLNSRQAAQIMGRKTNKGKRDGAAAARAQLAKNRAAEAELKRLKGA